MTPTTLAARGVHDPSLPLTLGTHVEVLRQYIVGVLAREGCALDASTLETLSESVLAESVRLAVRWVEEDR